MSRRRNIARFALWGFFATASTASYAFEAGQHWACVTDQGADAFLAVIAVKDDAVTFSWGSIDRESDKLTSLCKQRDALSLQEIKSFCTLLGDGASEGHVRLSRACSAQ